MSIRKLLQTFSNYLSKSSKQTLFLVGGIASHNKWRSGSKVHRVPAELHLSPLVMKEPFLLRAESLLDVESQRRSGSDSSAKKPLVRSMGDWMGPMPPARYTPLPPPLLLGDSGSLWMGLRLWLTFTVVVSWLMSNCMERGDRRILTINQTSMGLNNSTNDNIKRH